MGHKRNVNTRTSEVMTNISFRLEELGYELDKIPREIILEEIRHGIHKALLGRQKQKPKNPPSDHEFNLELLQAVTSYPEGHYLHGRHIHINLSKSISALIAANISNDSKLHVFYLRVMEFTTPGGKFNKRKFEETYGVYPEGVGVVVLNLIISRYLQQKGLLTSEDSTNIKIISRK